MTTKVQIRLHWILKQMIRTEGKKLAIKFPILLLLPRVLRPLGRRKIVYEREARLQPSVKSVPQCLSFTLLSLFATSNPTQFGSTLLIISRAYAHLWGRGVPFERAAGRVVVYLQPEETHVSLWRNSAATPGVKVDRLTRTCFALSPHLPSEGGRSTWKITRMTQEHMVWWRPPRERRRLQR